MVSTNRLLFVDVGGLVADSVEDFWTLANDVGIQQGFRPSGAGALVRTHEAFHMHCCTNLWRSVLHINA